MRSDTMDFVTESLMSNAASSLLASQMVVQLEAFTVISFAGWGISQSSRLWAS